MSYATLLVYVNVDHVSKQLVGVAAGLADKFSARLIGLSALAIMPPFVAESVVIVDNASEFDIAQMKAKLADAGNEFGASVGADRQTEWRSVLEFPTDTLVSEARCADLIVVGQSKFSGVFTGLRTTVQRSWGRDGRFWSSLRLLHRLQRTMLWSDGRMPARHGGRFRMRCHSSTRRSA
jgi:nucleotide-binding universal stress UspA family protein